MQFSYIEQSYLKAISSKSNPFYCHLFPPSPMKEGIHHVCLPKSPHTQKIRHFDLYLNQGSSPCFFATEYPEDKYRNLL